MTKIPVNFYIDGELLTKLQTYAAQSGCTVAELVEQFCQQGLQIAGDNANPVATDSLPERLAAIELNMKNILERLLLLESKVDVDIDVNDFLQNWQASLELRIASFVEKRVEEILRSSPRPAENERSQARYKGLVDAPHIDSDDDDEPDEILTDFLEP